jgi:primosomal protein N' (replication factor Y)
VAGRAGRGKEGKVLIQSSNPEHFAIKSSSEHNYLNFYRKEIAFRKEAIYPPFIKLARIVVKAKDFKTAEKAAENLKDRILKMNEKKVITILGPVECPIGKIEKYYRFHILLKSKKGYILNNILRKLYGKKVKDTKISLEIDPINML